MGSSGALYIDESGNTARNIHDGDQPIYVAAALWLTAPQLDELTAEMPELRKAAGLSTTKELKGANLVATETGRSFVAKLLQHLRLHVYWVSLVVVEKRHLAAGQLVDDCTDGFFNDAYLDHFPANSAQGRSVLADLFYRHADEKQLALVWKMRKESKEGFIAANRKLLNRLCLHLDATVAKHAALMLKTDFERLWKSIADKRTGSRKHSGIGPNLTAFTCLLNQADHHAQSLGWDSVDVIHDEQVQFKTEFENAWHILSGESAVVAALPSHSGFASLTNLQFADSTTSLGIQVADFIASAARVALGNSLVNDELSESLQQLLRGQPPTLAYKMFGSDAWARTVCRQLGVP